MTTGDHQDSLSIPIQITERHGRGRVAESIRIGVPLSKGLIKDSDELCLRSSDGRSLPYQGRVLGRWPDRSTKWLLIDALIDVSAMDTANVFLERRDTDAAPFAPAPLRISEDDHQIAVDTAAAQFHIPRMGRVLLSAVHVSGVDVLSQPGLEVQLQDTGGDMLGLDADEVTVEEQGPVAAVVLVRGKFSSSDRTAPVRYSSRMKFVAGSRSVQIDFTIWNPRAAIHAGGVWDLGDPGSYHFSDLSLVCRPNAEPSTIRWYDTIEGPVREITAGSWLHYQDSSGGDRWDSINHVDRHRRSTVTFRGYRVTDSGANVLSAGLRSTPGVMVCTDKSWIGCAIRDHWQSFPKALCWSGGQLECSLFPRETAAGFELQGGEQKRHTVCLDVGLSDATSNLAEWQHPVDVAVDPAWIAKTGAVASLSAATSDDDQRCARYINQAVEGPQSFFARREIIDEYGWRHFGDLYADHEAVNHSGPAPFISHYNNQYDFIYGAFIQFQRTGLASWRALMADAARHAIDIDVYRTSLDRAAFNGGLFWHTDHHESAGTATHRTYSRLNRRGRRYGGGPSNEHNYSSGFLHYFYLTGDPSGADAVRRLADWVVQMDDGALNMWALVDDGPTGNASATRDGSYHGPGRGAGNSINTLLDAYALTSDRAYFRKAEDLLRRCIHPRDDVDARHLDDPENRWSYLVFLQILGRYLGQKRDMGETDYMFWYGRDSLIRYARWMKENEVPYKQVLHKVDFPTETWAAHDIRKSHVFDFAALYSSGSESREFKECAAFFFDRCLQDLLEFPTAALTRPLVILCVYGSLHEYFRRLGPVDDQSWSHGHEFGTPREFVPQRMRLKTTLSRKVDVVRRDAERLLRQCLASVWRR